MKTAGFILIAISAVVHRASGHGRLMDPPGRSSAWRLGFSTPHNYDDNALFCGGFSVGSFIHTFLRSFSHPLLVRFYFHLLVSLSIHIFVCLLFRYIIFYKLVPSPS